MEKANIGNLLRDELRCILPDGVIRYDHNFVAQNIPHLKDPRTGFFRSIVHDSVFVSTDMNAAAVKFRTSSHRKNHYDYGKAFGEECFMYVFSTETMMNAGFVEVGLAYGSSKHSCNIGKTRKPVLPDGCYRVKWNGRGYNNATFEWMQLNN